MDISVTATATTMLPLAAATMLPLAATLCSGGTSGQGDLHPTIEWGVIV